MLLCCLLLCKRPWWEGLRWVFGRGLRQAQCSENSSFHAFLNLLGKRSGNPDKGLRDTLPVLCCSKALQLSQPLLLPSLLSIFFSFIQYFLYQLSFILLRCSPDF